MFFVHEKWKTDTDKVKEKRGEKSIECETLISRALRGRVRRLSGFDPVVEEVIPMNAGR